jgi:hypothetical protein
MVSCDCGRSRNISPVDTGALLYRVDIDLYCTASSSFLFLPVRPELGMEINGRKNTNVI